MRRSLSARDELRSRSYRPIRAVSEGGRGLRIEKEASKLIVVVERVEDTLLEKLRVELPPIDTLAQDLHRSSMEMGLLFWGTLFAHRINNTASML